MEPRLKIHGLWRLREETMDDCAARANATFERLGELTPRWRIWHRSYRSLDDRKVGPITLSGQLDRIREELLTNRVLLPNGEVNEELGYCLSASAGPEKGKGTESSFLWLACCVRSLYSFNELSLELPVELVAPELYDTEFLCRAVSALAAVWDPDWLAVWDRVTKMVPEPWVGGPTLGWVNYLPARTGVISAELPARWRWFDSRGEKQIFVHEGGPPNKLNPNHVDAFRELAERTRWEVPSSELRRND